MTIAVNDTLPGATFRFLGADGPDSVASADLFGGKKVAVFGMPGAFTRTCSADHLPGVMAAVDGLKGKGVDEVVVLTVNDIFVVDAWAKSSEAEDSGVRFLVDYDAGFVKEIGLSFAAEPVGFTDRAQRFSMLVEDGVVTALNVEEPGQCSLTTGETLLGQV